MTRREFADLQRKALRGTLTKREAKRLRQAEESGHTSPDYTEKNRRNRQKQTEEETPA